MTKKGKITGIGGVFFKCKDPETMRKWYQDYFGLDSDKYGHAFLWKKPEDTEKNAYTAWNAFDENSNYFDPSKQKYMINYRVENLENLIHKLKQNGIKVIGEIETFDYGKFGWVLDPEGNKIELCVFDEYYGNT